MAHKAQLENKKYMNWLRAGLGTKYVKEGLEPFCDHLVKQQHIDILDEVKRKHNLLTVSCGLCDVRTLQPDHVQTKTRQCPLGQISCNCLHHRGKMSCPNKVCGAIYDEIIKSHASTPPAPYWRNTDAHQWCTEPWAVAKCFINAPGYEQKKSVVEFDCSCLLHLLINNMEFHQHIQCVISGQDIFTSVLRRRNAIFHSDSMELEDSDFTACVDDMIELLKDDKEIQYKSKSKEVVKKLLELKQEHFIITTTDETEIRRIAMSAIDEKEKSLQQKIVDGKTEIGIALSAIDEKEKSLQQKIVDGKNEIGIFTDQSEHQVKMIGSTLNNKLVQTGLEIKEDLKKAEIDSKQRLEQKETEIKHNLRTTEIDLKKILEQKEKIKHNLRMTEVDSKQRLDQKETEIKDNLIRKEVDSKDRLEQKEPEMKETLSIREADSKTRMEQKETEIKDNLRVTRKVSKETQEQTKTEIKENLKVKEIDSQEKMEQKKIEMKENFRMIELNSKPEQKKSNIPDNLRMREVVANKRLDQKGTEVGEDSKRKLKHIPDQQDRQLIEHTRSEAISKEDDLKKVDTRAMPLPNDHERKSADFQRKLIKRYERFVRQVSSIPLKPHRKKINVCDVYVPPWMTVDIKNEQSKKGEEVKISMHEIFRNEEGHAKYSNIIGEAGTGKNIFCKMLLHFWCIAHSHQETDIDEPNIVNEMNRFKFLFYVSLRNFADFDSIEQMIENAYHDRALKDILQNESGKCLIVLDGLDEWTPGKKYNSQFLTPGLPGRELHADYTIITTTRQWKFDVLQINENEVDTKINIKGIDTFQMPCFTEKTVKMLNDSFQQSKNAAKCQSDLNSRHVSDISHIPLILQQLICLWFDDKLRENAKHAIYSNMLSLFFEWNTLKRTTKIHEREIVTQERISDLPLPDYLSDFKTLQGNIHVLHYLSQLAYETLFDKNKATTLTFSPAALERLNIPSDIVKYCLEIGILTEGENESMPASTSQQSSYSFFHKSLQEYLAAVYVASQLQKMLNSRKLSKKGNGDVYETCVKKFFGSYKTVVDILDQSNVLIILCGLELWLLTNISKYIYAVTLVDEVLVKERFALKNKLVHQSKLIADVQACISLCIEEVMSREKTVHTTVYIADIYITRSKDLRRYVKNVIPKNVLSVHVDILGYEGTSYDEETYLALEYLTNCDQLKTIKYNRADERIDNILIKILDGNVTTLETVSFPIVKTRLTSLASILRHMRKLTKLEMSIRDPVTISHDDCVPWCRYLNQTTRLQHIALGIRCENNDLHKIDLSKHKQLQHLDFMFSSFCTVSCNTDNLETCKLSITSVDMMNQVCDIMYKADKLKYLCLYCESYGRYSITECRAVTEYLIRLLPALGSLSILELWSFTLTSNIIARPPNMKNLKEITLDRVTMRMAMWIKFIDSLPKLPQLVNITTNAMDIRDQILGYRDRDEKQVTAAIQYVRMKTNLFRVTSDDAYFFKFTNLKINKSV